MSYKKRIAITGGAGFIGSHMVRLLVNKYPEYLIVNFDKLTYAGNLENLLDIESKPNYIFVNGDICSEKDINCLFETHRISDIIHLAAESHVDRSIHSPNEFVNTNVIGTVKLLQCANKHWANKNEHIFYHVSTDEVYGSLGETGLFTEKTSYDPRSPYSAAKAASDHFVRAFSHTYGLTIKISNCSNNYGSHHFPEKLIPLMIHNIMNNKELIFSTIKKLKAGWNFGSIREEFAVQYIVKRSETKPGTYRNITGNNAVALGLVAAAEKANLPLFLGSYPITPATEILHFLSGYKQQGVKHLQAEDEIGGITSAIGAAYGGALAATTTSGPGLSLKVEAIGLAVMLELPLIIVDVMRAGPSTGLPTKPEQSDLLMAVHGRHGEAPLPVIAAYSAASCFEMTVEAARLAVKYMTPVILLTDGYIGQGAEPWRIPSLEELPDIPVEFASDPETFQPYKRDEVTLARPWAIPGTPGLEHRIGGLEKQDVTGNVSHDPMNHQRMTELREEKINRIENDIPEAVIEGPQEGNVLVLAWGSSYGAVKTAFEELLSRGHEISYCHLKYINPFPRNLGEILKKFDKIVVPEMNTGQLKLLLQAKYLIPIEGINKIQGIPFTAQEIEDNLEKYLKEGK